MGLLLPCDSQVRPTSRSFFILKLQGLARLACLASLVSAHWSTVLDNGPVRGFPTQKQSADLLNGWVQKYPTIFRRYQIGKSFENRPIDCYVLGSQTAASPARPKVLLTSLTHAREPAGLTVLLYFLGRLIELYYEGNPQAVYFVEMRELFAVPFVNIDGYIANEASRTKMIRKNRRPTCQRSKDSGVDLNRNFAYQWRHEFAKCNEEYEGTAAFSEPETQALKLLIEQNKFLTALNYHCYGSMLTHPFNYMPHPKLPIADHQAIYDEIGKVFGYAKFGPAAKTVGYTTHGESDDWMYGVHGIIAMSPEVGPENGGFWPPKAMIKGINTRNFKRTAYVVHKSGFELMTEWRHMPLSSLGDWASKITPVPQGAIRLNIANRGLSASFGSALMVAISGLALGSSPPMVYDNSGTKLQAQVRGLPKGDALVLNLRPAQARSKDLSVLLFHTGPSVSLCAAETISRGGQPWSMCQCHSGVQLHGESAVKSGAIEFMAVAGNMALNQLCNAATSPFSAAGPAPAPPAYVPAPSVSAPAVAAPVPAPATGIDQAPPPPVPTAPSPVTVLPNGVKQASSVPPQVNMIEPSSRRPMLVFAAGACALMTCCVALHVLRVARNRMNYARDTKVDEAETEPMQVPGLRGYERGPLEGD